MEDIQFIIESPQTSTSHKKRPRLVTSCDNCRLKKIKCLQPSPETKCEACKVAKIPCRFKDRERYFAERSRAIAGPSANVHSPSYSTDQRHEQNPALDAFSVASSSSSPSLSNSAPRSNSHSPKASGLVSPEGDPNGRYPYPPDTRRDPNYRHSANSSISSFHSRNNSYGYSNYMGSPAPVLPHPNSRPPTQPQQDYRHVQLFEPDRDVPPNNLMQHYIQVFIENLGHEYPFLTYDQLMHDAWEGRMPPPLANVIAAMASRFVTIPELTIRGLHNVAEAYTDAAKAAFSASIHIRNMDMLHAGMLLAWLEFKNQRLTSFRQYSDTSVALAQSMGLQAGNNSMLSDAERRRADLTWANILQLHALTRT